jgi:imidazolonepropionase-like amidohydrolase
LDSEALLGVIDGRIKLHVHCYRTDGMEALFRLADEFKFKVSALHHALEAYKIPALLKKRGVIVVTFADLGYYKSEAVHATTRNAALLTQSGVKVALHTDHPVIEQRYFIHEAAKAVRYGLSREDAFRAITLHPALAMGIDKMVGTLEVGKHADIVVWEGDPLEIGSFARIVFIDGELVHSADRAAP